MKYFYLILRVLVGATFLVSGIAKLFPIEPFENTFIELGVSNWLLVPFIARLVIAFELFIGTSIILNLWLKNKVYYLAQASLVFFTGYLVFLLISKGNDVDCGCFGSLITLSPIMSIIKNVVLIIALFFIPRPYYRFNVGTTFGFVVLSSLALPAIINPIGIHNLQGIEVNDKVDLSELPLTYGSNNKVEFSKGKKLVAFLSYKCSHCINATRKFGLLDSQQKINNLYLVVGSRKEKGLHQFIDETKTEFPIIWMNDDTFFKYAGGRLPAIVYIEDGIMKRKWYGDLFDVDEMKEYIID